METLCGILVDVSGSMERNVTVEGNHENSSWIRSIFRTVDSLIKHDVTSNNHVFALAVGGREEPVTFDLLNTVQLASSIPISNITKESLLEKILSLLERNGAPRVRKWAKMSVLEEVVEVCVARFILYKLENDSRFRNKFIYECLPKSCREIEIAFRSIGNELLYFGAGFLPGAQEFATRDSVKEVIIKGRELLFGITPNSIMDVHKASDILHGSVQEDELTNDRVDDLKRDIEPFIYGRTPLIKAMSEATKLFARPEFKHHKKLMFILSDGDPTDGKNPPVQQLNDLNVNVVSCYITDDRIHVPKRLYSLEEESWPDDVKFMFRISSIITTQEIPRTIFLKHGWTIDITNNETRLFAQVNHPDIIQEVCKLAREVVCCREALSDVLSSVSLDLYINQKNRGFTPTDQTGNTCYANATAAVLHLAMCRIHGRVGGLPDFFVLRNKIINIYERQANNQGASSLRVLKEMCPLYRLQCKEVDIHGAIKAITAKRPVLATFRLTNPELDIFEDFYSKKNDGVLTKADLDISKRSKDSDTHGHAVVFTGFNSESLRFMNSGGSDWGDEGFFRVSNENVLGLKFVDVFWEECDLLPTEIDAYKNHGKDVAHKLFKRLKGLQCAEYKCPLCENTSFVSKFTGHHLRAVCPTCCEAFDIKTAGDDLALNFYLLSCSDPIDTKK